jgi:DNA-binding NtrC family response regulator
LRERRMDIKLLAAHFLEQLASDENIGPKHLSPAALSALESYDWPGNVRELFNVLHRAVLLTPGRQILPCHIALPTVPFTNSAHSANFRSSRAQVIAAFERQYVQEMLDRHNGNITHAARDAGQDRRAFGRLAKKYKMCA